MTTYVPRVRSLALTPGSTTTARQARARPAHLLHVCLVEEVDSDKQLRVPEPVLARAQQEVANVLHLIPVSMRDSPSLRAGQSQKTKVSKDREPNAVHTPHHVEVEARVAVGFGDGLRLDLVHDLAQDLTGPQNLNPPRSLPLLASKH